MKWTIAQIFTTEFWTDYFKNPPIFYRFFAKIYRLSQKVINGFNTDECSEKASALTFYSLLSIVPILAVAFGIAKGFGFEENLQSELKHRFIEQRKSLKN